MCVRWLLFLCISPFQYFARQNLALCRCVRNRFAASIIVRFFSCLSVQEQEELVRGSANASLGSGGRYSRKSHAVLRICNARTLRILRSGARVPRSVLRRFFPACSRARRGQIRRAMQPWEERTGRDSSRLRAFPRFRERPIPRATSHSFSTEPQRSPTSSGCVAARSLRKPDYLILWLRKCVSDIMFYVLLY